MNINLEKKFSQENLLFKFVIIPIFFLIPVIFTSGSYSINVVLVLFFFIFIYFIFLQKISFSFKENLSFVLIILFLLCNSLVSNNFEYSIFKSVGYIRFITFSLLTIITIQLLNDNYKKKYIFSLFLLIIFLLLDVFVQFMTDVNLLNMKVQYNVVYGRLSSIFGSEYIIGIFLFTLCYIFFGLFKIFYSNNFFEIIFILIFNIAIFLTGERNAVLTSLLTLFIIFLLNKNLRKNIFISTILIFFSYFLILMNSDILKNRYSIGAIQINSSEPISLNQENIITDNQQNNSKFFNKFYVLKDRVINSQWFAHYRGGIEIFKKNKIMGSGFKTFRFECKNDKEKNISCPTHPHNIYIELLSDTGIIGLIIFVILNFL